MKFLITYCTQSAGPGLKPFGRKQAGPTERGLMFNQKLLMHATNNIVGIVHEIEIAKGPISLQRISTSLLRRGSE
jgi:hypothetical protein